MNNYLLQKTYILETIHSTETTKPFVLVCGCLKGFQNGRLEKVKIFLMCVTAIFLKFIN